MFPRQDRLRYGADATVKLEMHACAKAALLKLRTQLAVALLV